MIGFIKVFRRMPVWGIVTAADVPALHAEAQVHPRVACFDTILTPISAGGDYSDLIQMCATSFHFILSST
jgi:hypothetical protein